MAKATTRKATKQVGVKKDGLFLKDSYNEGDVIFRQGDFELVCNDCDNNHYAYLSFAGVKVAFDLFWSKDVETFNKAIEEVFNKDFLKAQIEQQIKTLQEQLKKLGQ